MYNLPNAVTKELRSFNQHLASKDYVFVIHNLIVLQFKKTNTQSSLRIDRGVLLITNPADIC